MIPPGEGGWGDKYPSKWYQVTFAEQLLRDWRGGYMPASPSPDEAYLLDPDDNIHLQPRYYSTIYQARIGLSPDWQLYIQWPSQSYRLGLEEPNYNPVPTERTDRGYIGFIDSTQSPIKHPIDPDQAMRFEMFFVRDWMPVFYAYVNSITDYAKLIMRFLVNKCTIQAITDEAIRAKLERKELPYKPVFHYSVYEARAKGVTA
jgi:hypothetical protein